MARATINDREREMWVLNDEGLYSDQRRSRLSMREYLRQNREMIDDVIRRVTTREPARPRYADATRRGACAACGKKNDLYGGVCLSCVSKGVRPVASADFGGKRQSGKFVDHRAHGHPTAHPPGEHLSAAERARLKPSDFALPQRRDLPIHRRVYIGPATARLEMMRRLKSVTAEEYVSARRRIAAAARHFGVESMYLE